MGLAQSLKYRYNALFNKSANDVFGREHAHIDRAKFPYFFASRYYVRMLEKGGAGFFERDNMLLVRINDVVFHLFTKEEIFILAEIFCLGSYDFNTNDSCTVIDIGMNVGMASLYFASLPNVQHVYSF